MEALKGHRKVKKKDFVGKTINVIYFTDNTSIALEIEYFYSGIYGIGACEICPQENK